MTELKLREQVQLDAKVINEIIWQGSRITGMLNQAQDWLQQQLLKTGSLNWKTEVAISFSDDTLQGISMGKADVPSNWLKDMPIEQIYPTAGVAVGVGVTKPAKEINIRNLASVIRNSYLTPTVNAPIFVVMDTDIFSYPMAITDGDCVYTRKVLDLVFDNDSVDTEIPKNMEQALIDRVVSQVNIIKAGEQLTQVLIQEIDKRIAKQYQLDGAKAELQDKKVAE